jgi:hypothetical protein
MRGNGAWCKVLTAALGRKPKLMKKNISRIRSRTAGLMKIERLQHFSGTLTLSGSAVSRETPASSERRLKS